MKCEHNLYDRYTSTSSLAKGVHKEDVITWSKGYFRAHFSHLLPENKHANILEVGCGYGRYIKTMLEMGYTNCYGIDLSREQISYAKTKLGLSNVELADALDWLNGKESMFDCILGLDILEHFQTVDLLRLGEKIYRALKPGGSVIFQVPNGMSPLNPVIYGDLTHIRAFTPQSMQQFLLNVGLVPKGYFEIPPHIHGIKSALKRAFWTGVVKPGIGLLVKVIHGRMPGGNIYTSNFIVYAKKDLCVDLDDDGGSGT
jgi:2-polyprenyl-3-methyl-5-hydroxy-6-metoxy-1,4-benzoquinol methylase